MSRESDNAATGNVTCEEARAILQRFNNSHWNNPGEKARYSIPAEPKRDDDLRLAAFIDQTEEATAEADRLRAKVAQLEGWLNERAPKREAFSGDAEGRS